MVTRQIGVIIDSQSYQMTKAFGEAINALREGKPILLLDAHDRENESDLVIAAEKITPESMNFLIKKGSGIVCIAMPKERLLELGLPLMISDNTNFFQTAFTVSIEASQGVTTGVSAKDRAHTMRVAMADNAHSSHLARPGHVFPLAARLHGVFERMGHTEGSVDLMRIAGLKAGAALCELMNEDGSMTVGEDRVMFAKRYGIPVISVEEVLFFRIQNEEVLSEKRETLKRRWGDLLWHSFNFFDAITIHAFYKADFKPLVKPIRLFLSREDNVFDPFMKRDHLSDDFLDQHLTALHSNEADLIFIGTVHEKDLKTAEERKLRQHAVICRVLQKLQVKNIAKDEVNYDLERILETYFAINVM